MYNLEGTVKVVLDTQTFDSGFQKREVVVTTDNQYPQDIKMEFIKDSIEQLEALKPGDAVKVAFDLSGREWTDPQGVVKYFTNVKGIRISKMNSGETTAAAASDIPEASDADDLPF